jgi:SAM-dependent methyltransferase
MTSSSACKLCRASTCVSVGRNKHREFLHCPSCGLVCVPPAFWLSVDDERARYGHHDNVPSNRGYVDFLGEVVDVVATLAPPGGRVLDFGSGENAVLTELLRGRGLVCTAYDPLYGIGHRVLDERYDVIVLCEVIEHLHNLRAELARIGNGLAPSGKVVVRTRCYPSLEALPTWWYARDATHVNLFSRKALAYAAELCGTRLAVTGKPDIFVWSRSN